MGNYKAFFKPSKYNKEYCHMLLDHMGKGHSIASFSAVINIPASTINNWLDKHPEFAKAYELGLAKALIKIEELMLGQSEGKIKNGSAASLAFYAKNLLPNNFQDKRSIQVDVEQHIELSDQELLEAIEVDHKQLN